MNPSDASLLRQAADSAAGAQHYPPGALYVVATPIGNLADLSLRAIHVFGLVDAIACEDTRHSAPLLRALGIEAKPLLAVHAHNEREAAAGVLLRHARGERVACISDAGTPAISDPGAALVVLTLPSLSHSCPLPLSLSLPPTHPTQNSSSQYQRLSLLFNMPTNAALRYDTGG